MNCYDFDKTIYKNDCSIKFYFFCLKKHPALIFHFFKILFYTFLHLIKFVSTKSYKEKFFSFLSKVDGKNLVEEFWNKELNNIADYYKSQMKENDVIVSASPEFLVSSAMAKINSSARVLATNMDISNGHIEGNNLKGTAKREMLESLNLTNFENAYSDSISDLPMFDLAENKYIVNAKKEKLYEFGKQKPTFMQKLKNLIKLMRPKHYLKNGLIFMPLFFSKKAISHASIKSIILGFIAFCCISSFVYIINDLKDVKRDRVHSKKRMRPIASYMVKPSEAIILALILLTTACSLHFYVFETQIIPTIVFFSYPLINIFYSFKLKEIPIIDVFVLSFCYLVRIFYGGLILYISISKWFYLTVLAAALFMGFGKRRNEITNEKHDSRKVNRIYTKDFLDKNMYVCLALTLTFYSLWVILNNTASLERINAILLYATIPLVYMIMMKYSQIIEGESTGDPINVLLTSKSLIIFALIYIAILVISLYVPINISLTNF